MNFFNEFPKKLNVLAVFMNEINFMVFYSIYSLSKFFNFNCYIFLKIIKKIIKLLLIIGALLLSPLGKFFKILKCKMIKKYLLNMRVSRCYSDQ